MNPIESKYFLDSSAWISYFLAANEGIKNIVENPNALFTSVISIFEIKRKLLRDGLEESKIKSVLSYILEKSIIIKLDPAVCESAAEFSLKNKLPAIDSLIHSSSLSVNCILVTGDSRFKNLNRVMLI